MKSFLLAVFLLILEAACYSNNSDMPNKRFANNCLKAMVVNTRNRDCGYPELSFAEDSAAICAVTGQNSVVYVAKYLPAALNIQGKKLCVTVTKLPAEEEFPCTMMGISFPHIKIVSAEERK